MRALLRVAMWIAGLWLLLCVASLTWWPWTSAADPLRLRPPEYLGTPAAPLFVGQIQEAVYALARQCPLPRKRRLIVLGASGSRAYDPAILARSVDADEVLNLSVVLSNFTQLRQVQADLLACLGAEGMRDTRFVLILALGSFTGNALRNDGAYTDYETEKLRSHLFSGPPGSVVPVLPRDWLPAAVELWRPVLLVRKWTVGLREWVQRLRRHQPGHAPVRSAAELDREWSLRLISNLQPELEAGGAYAPEQSAELDALITDIRGAGGTVVLVEQPAQRWLREDSKAFPAAHDALQAAAARHGVPYLDFSASATDEEFHDAMHANALGGRLWSERLAQALEGLRLERDGGS